MLKYFLSQVKEYFLQKHVLKKGGLFFFLRARRVVINFYLSYFKWNSAVSTESYASAITQFK